MLQSLQREWLIQNNQSSSSLFDHQSLASDSIETSHFSQKKKTLSAQKSPKVNDADLELQMADIELKEVVDKDIKNHLSRSVNRVKRGNRVLKQRRDRSIESPKLKEAEQTSTTLKSKTREPSYLRRTKSS